MDGNVLNHNVHRTENDFLCAVYHLLKIWYWHIGEHQLIYKVRILTKQNKFCCNSQAVTMSSTLTSSRVKENNEANVDDLAKACELQQNYSV